MRPPSRGEAAAALHDRSVSNTQLYGIEFFSSFPLPLSLCCSRSLHDCVWLCLDDQTLDAMFTLAAIFHKLRSCTRLRKAALVVVLNFGSC